MTPEIIGQIITAVVTIAGLLFTYLKSRDAALAARSADVAAKAAVGKSEENYTAIQLLDTKTDGRLTQLLETRAKQSEAEAHLARAEGVVAGGLAEAARLAGAGPTAAAAAPDVAATAAAIQLLSDAAETARQVLATAERLRTASPLSPTEALTAATERNTTATDRNTAGGRTDSPGPDDVLARTLRLAGTGPVPETTPPP